MCVTRDRTRTGGGRSHTPKVPPARGGDQAVISGLSRGLHLRPLPPRALSTVQGTPEKQAGRETDPYENLQGSALYTTLRDLGTPTS